MRAPSAGLVGPSTNMSDKDIARLNVEHFRRLLATDIDDAKRHTILQLLAEEEAKLAPLNDRRRG
jgi:hypothetical protein